MRGRTLTLALALTTKQPHQLSRQSADGGASEHAGHEETGWHEEAVGEDLVSSSAYGELRRIGLGLGQP